MLLLAALASAVPMEITHSARVLDASGEPLNGPIRVTVTLHESLGAEEALYTEVVDDVPVSDGYFTVRLTDVDTTVFDGSTRYVGVVAGTTTLEPRFPVVSVPYAVRAQTVDEVVVGAVADACSAGLDGRLRWQDGSLQVCDGAGPAWVSVSGTPDGSSASRPAKTCATLNADYPNLPSGTYWIDPDELGAPFQVRCDMQTDGGGWTVITNNSNGDTEPSGCIPRIAAHSDFVCGTVTNASNDWSAPAWELDFDEMVWAAYTGEFNVTSYNYLTWSSAQDMPNSNGAWYRVATSSAVTLNDWSALPKIGCNGSYGPIRAVGNRARSGGTVASDYGNVVLTLWTGSTGHTNFQMSFTEYSVWTGGQSMRGLDDFQDGQGCSDDWSPRSNRGYSSFVMLR